jgi:tRNA (uracil-5-)-methyltransferase
MSKALSSLLRITSISRLPLINLRRGVHNTFYDAPEGKHRPRNAPDFLKKMPKHAGRRIPGNRKLKKQKAEQSGAGEEIEEILRQDIKRLLKSGTKAENNESQSQSQDASEPILPETFTEIEVKVSDISSTGDGLALSEDGDHVYVVPFTVPGDKALVKVVRHVPPYHYSVTDFLKVIEPGPQRDDSQIKCQYFSKCSGCQLQMMSYADQLQHKKRIVEKAYANFSGLIPELIPAIGDTFPSPLQYGYRTKLTPHFASPVGSRPKKGKPEWQPNPQVPPIGFTFKNRRLNVDIEDCPLGTDIVRKGLKRERKRVLENLHTYTKGATLLMRESTTRVKKDETQPMNGEDFAEVIRTEHPDYIEEKRCVTDNNATSTEYVDDYIFTNKAGAFFQNNNSILSGFTDYIRQQAHPQSLQENEKPIKYLLDAYSGSGLFTVTLSTSFLSSLGVDIADDSIISARENAKANDLPNTGFAAADAASLFKDIPYPPDETLLVIDPPRKGCSDDFLKQLLAYGPRRVAYVSCNVHTQARDVGVLVQGGGVGDCRYDIESIRGFDFFPQTGHVEGVAILNKVYKTAGGTDNL